MCTAFVHSGIVYSDISDHLLILKKNKPLILKLRPISSMSVRLIKSGLRLINWTYLHQLDRGDAFRKCTEHLNYVIASIAPKNTVTIKLKYIIRNVYNQRSIVTSSITANKL